MNIELRNHPATVKHQTADGRVEMKDKQGKPYPLHPDMRAVYVEGVMCGYCTKKKNMPLNMIKRFPDNVQKDITAGVEEQLGLSVRRVSSVPELESFEETNREDDEE